MTVNILVFKTDITTKRKENSLQVLFDDHPDILCWSVDKEDVDKVLRIETTPNTTEDTIINLVTSYGITCENLPD